ncbi:MAG: acyl-CoA dehydrogenase [Oscillospiraceae bacterium]
MDFHFTEEQQELVAMFRDFAQQEIKPRAAEMDETEEFPHDIVEQMKEMGLLGLPYPEEYGGAGLDTVTYIAAIEEFCKVCGTMGIILSSHVSLCQWPIYTYGTEVQKEKYLIPLATGEVLGAFGLTEPSAGTDASMQKSVAEDKGDYFLLNGSKMFISNSQVAGTYVVFAKTDPTLGSRGISAFILERGMEGFQVGEKIKKMGIRASDTCELLFQDVKVPKANLLGELGQGFHIAMATLDGGRISIAAQALGIAQGAIDETVLYTRERVQFGKRLSQFQNTQFELAEMQTDVDAARLLVYRAAAAKDNGEDYTHQAAMAKMFAARTASDVTRRCLQLFGGYGFTREYPIECKMRDAKITEIYEGTTEVQKMVVSSWMGVK